MLKIIGDTIWYILSGMGVGFMAFLKALPIFNELGNIKEEIVACAIGVPAVVISIAFMVPSIIKFIKKIAD